MFNAIRLKKVRVAWRAARAWNIYCRYFLSSVGKAVFFLFLLHYSSFMNRLIDNLHIFAALSSEQKVIERQRKRKAFVTLMIPHPLFIFSFNYTSCWK